MTGLDVVNSTIMFPLTGTGVDHWGHFHEFGHNEQVRLCSQLSVSNMPRSTGIATVAPLR